MDTLGDFACDRDTRGDFANDTLGAEIGHQGVPENQCTAWCSAIFGI